MPDAIPVNTSPSDDVARLPHADQAPRDSSATIAARNMPREIAILPKKVHPITANDTMIQELIFSSLADARWTTNPLPAVKRTIMSNAHPP